MTERAQVPIDSDTDFRVMGPDEWQHQRWGWLEGVRRDSSLSPMARLVGHVLALDFAHNRTLRCNPSYRQIATLLEVSPDTVKRCISGLIEAGWIGREQGDGRGHSSHYCFLTRARIVHIKGGRFAPTKGGSNAPVYRSVKGADLHGKGGKTAPGHNIAKPLKNHSARGPAREAAQNTGKISDNPMVAKDAAEAVRRYRAGRTDAITDCKAWVIDHIIAANLLTDAERQALDLQ